MRECLLKFFLQTIYHLFYDTLPLPHLASHCLHSCTLPRTSLAPQGTSSSPAPHHLHFSALHLPWLAPLDSFRHPRRAVVITPSREPGFPAPPFQPLPSHKPPGTAPPRRLPRCALHHKRPGLSASLSILFRESVTIVPLRPGYPLHLDS